MTFAAGLSANLLGIVYILIMLAEPYQEKFLTPPKAAIRKTVRHILFFLMLDTLYRLLLPLPGVPAESAAFLFKSLYLIENSYLVFLWCRYLGLVIWDKEYYSKWYSHIYSVGLGINIVLAVMNIPLPVLFRLEGGVFRVIYGGMWVFTIVNYLSIAISYVSMLRNRDKIRSNTLLLHLLYPVFPIIGEILQILLRDVDLTSVYTLSAFLIFQVNRRSDSLLDPLTGVGNRRLLEEKLGNWLSGSRREYVCGIMVDIDNLKQINDRLGHLSGDRAICQVADVLKQVPNISIIPARYAGDEFVLIWQSDNPGEMENVVRYLRSEEREINAGLPLEKRVHYSVGAASADPAVEMTPEDFLRMLDREMYCGKHAIDEDIEYALRNNTCRIVLQPIYSVKKKRFTAAEALLRVRNAAGEDIPTARVITAAEKSGSIALLERFVLRAVCCFIRDNKLSSLGLDFISVNLSALRSLQPQFAEDILRVLREYRIPPSQLCLELTETAMSLNQDALEDNLQKLKDAGVRIAMDDYGSGYSNLYRMANLPLQQIKIDRIISTATEPRAVALFTMVAQMLSSLPVDIVVEGIETESQALRMEALGIDLLQGYYFAHPMAPEKLTALLRTGK